MICGTTPWWLAPVTQPAQLATSSGRWSVTPRRRGHHVTSWSRAMMNSRSGKNVSQHLCQVWDLILGYILQKVGGILSFLYNRRKSQRKSFSRRTTPGQSRAALCCREKGSFSLQHRKQVHKVKVVCEVVKQRAKEGVSPLHNRTFVIGKSRLERRVGQLCSKARVSVKRPPDCRQTVKGKQRVFRCR